MDQQYTFRKTYFLLDSETFVEMVTLVMDYSRQIGSKSKVETQVIESDSRELPTNILTKSFLLTLREKDNVVEEYKLTKRQADVVLKKYVTNLFDVNRDLLNSI